MKKILLIIVSSLSIINSAAIFAKDPNTIICPSVGALQSVQFDLAREVNGKWGAGVSSNHFGTNLTWKLLIEGITAKNSEDAIKIGSEAVKSLSFVAGPSHIKVECSNTAYCDVAMCEYASALGYEGYTYAIISEALHHSKT